MAGSPRGPLSVMLGPMVRCGRCAGPIDETDPLPVRDRQPCPVCGSTTRLLERSVEDSVTMRSSLAIKHVRGKTGTTAQEQFVGADQSVDGSWVDKAVVRDYEKDLYREQIVFPDGTTTRQEEPLSEHRGHGSDKPELRAERDRAKSEKREAHLARKRLNDRLRADRIAAAEEE